MNNLSRFKWWLLYLLVPLVVGLLVLDDDAPMSPIWHQVFAIAIVLVAGAVALAWVESNPRAMMGDDVEATAEPESRLFEFAEPDAHDLSGGLPNAQGSPNS